MLKLRILSAKDVEACLDMHHAIGLMRTAFGALSSGEALVPLRMHLPLNKTSGNLLLMPATIPGANALGFKMVTEFANNPAKSLPRIHALVIAIDAETGVPEALLDGEYLTALRTGAASGLATDLLARETAATVVIFGAGVQARTQLEAVCAVRSIQKAILFSPTRTKADRFSEEMSGRLGITILAGKSPEELRAADIICTATNSTTPVFDARFISPGTHINAIGAFQPHTREIPSKTVAEAITVVDQRKACLTAAGDLIIPIEEGMIDASHIRAELGEIVLGSREGRTAEDDITLFKSVGNGVQDIVCLETILGQAEILNRGHIVEL